MEEIHDSRGRVIATIFDGAPIVNVNDARGSNLGYGTQNGTFDARGNRVTTDPGQYGLLIPRDED
jgi:hypothetical protein